MCHDTVLPLANNHDEQVAEEVLQCTRLLTHQTQAQSQVLPEEGGGLRWSVGSMCEVLALLSSACCLHCRWNSPQHAT